MHKDKPNLVQWISTMISQSMHAKAQYNIQEQYMHV